MFLAQGVGMGLGAGIVYIPSMATVSYYFQKRMLNIMWHVQPFPSTTTTIIAKESAGSPATRADIQYRAFITVVRV
jgi:hypothetical protein